jgi:hypothetical protein
VKWLLNENIHFDKRHNFHQTIIQKLVFKMPQSWVYNQRSCFQRAQPGYNPQLELLKQIKNRNENYVIIMTITIAYPSYLLFTSSDTSQKHTRNHINCSTTDLLPSERKR